jgi:hypothetical protein
MTTATAVLKNGTVSVEGDSDTNRDHDAEGCGDAGHVQAAVIATPRETRWLADYVLGRSLTPRGMGPISLSNFIRRGWITRLTPEKYAGLTLHQITPVGREAYARACDVHRGRRGNAG